MNPTLKTILEQLQPQLETIVQRAKQEFLDRFGAWIESAHRDRLEQLFVQAGQARIACMMAQTEAEAQEQHEIFETLIEDIETLGLAVEIVGKAEARAILKSQIRAILNLIPVAAGIAVKIALPIAFPAIGSFVGPPAGAGVEWLLGKLLPTV